MGGVSAQAWILIAAIAAVLLVALVAGFIRYKRGRVSLTPPAEKGELADRSGGYQAAGGFSFSQGGQGATAAPARPSPAERTDTEGQPHIGDDAAIPRDAPRRGITDVPLPDAADTATTTAPEAPGGGAAAPTAPPESETTLPPETGTAAAPRAGQPGTSAAGATAPGDTGTAASGAAPAESATSVPPATGTPAPPVAETSSAPPTDEKSVPPAGAEFAPPSDKTSKAPSADPTAPPEAGKPAPAEPETTTPEAGGAVAAASTTAPDTETAPPATAPPAEPTTGEAPVVAPDTAAGAHLVPEVEEIEPTSGRLTRLRGRLSRSQNAVGKSLLGLLGGGDLDEESWEEVEDTLILADIGTAVTAVVVERLREEMAAHTVRTADEARAVLRDVLIESLRPELDRSVRALPHPDHPSILLVVGVNGTGKTTTTGKLARVLVADGRRVLLGAADTFRAAAADQLQTWGERVGADTVRGKEGADPAAVAFDAVASGIDAGVDVVLIDTAGRLHTKTGLMDELGKVKRVVEKKASVDEVLLVLDATVGQNGLMQARIFAEVVDISGVVLTKLDGTAKGGIVFQIQHELGVPVKLVGLGEGSDDLAPFEPAAFVDALLG
ncbi:signal recognition particle-docking protein FtsY [Nocardia speluncae]|uniref:Signal recognition particle receptor FtsY n=1 Tax=Nocardia speluncae TaxID=419477 RepID=A0A846XJ03_9NOCA|nr:signal recognition particle-docking protein FtsY [Nocardia speluncae]NKY35249.1 signal recognition particle-docking protein FtsY [Nocardia speluncae]